MPNLLGLVGLAFVFAGVGEAFGEAVEWLLHGNWVPRPFNYLWFAVGGPSSDRLGSPFLGTLLVWLLSQPMSLVLIVFGGCIIAVGKRFGKGR